MATGLRAMNGIRARSTIALAVTVGLTLIQATDPTHAQQTCDAPGHMLIMGGTEDPARVPVEVRERAKGYGPAVEKLILSFGAAYIVRGRNGRGRMAAVARRGDFRVALSGNWPDLLAFRCLPERR